MQLKSQSKFGDVRKFHNVNQNEDEWFELRKGRFTASMFGDLFATKTTAQYKKAIYKVVYERLTGESPESFSTPYMERGHELEPFAVEHYEMETFNETTNGGFWTLGDWIGDSPDRNLELGALEIKCPAYNTMIEYMLSKKLPSVYKWQVYGHIYVTGKDWCDFMSYHPKLKPVLIRVERDEKIITELEDKLFEAIGEAEKLLERLK